jgi:uncharacterized protein involved in exopolysaccharide biosynthesis
VSIAPTPAPGETTRDGDEDADSFRLLPLFNALLRHRWSVIGITGACALAAVAYSLMAQPTWTATAKFIPSSASSMSKRMGVIAGTEAGAGLDEDAASADYYVALLQSPSFLRTVVTLPISDDGGSESLVERFRTEGPDPVARERHAADILGKSLTVVASRPSASGGQRIVTLSVSANTPSLASSIGRTLIGRINLHNRENRSNRAKQNREFVESQLTKARGELDRATDDFSRFSMRNRRIATADLQAERDRLERQVRVQEEVFVTLTKQLELAKVEEQESRPSIEVIQEPDPPLVRTSPRRTQAVVMATFFGLFAACIWVFITERFRALPKDEPEAAEFRAHLSRLIGGGRR